MQCRKYTYGFDETVVMPQKYASSGRWLQNTHDRMRIWSAHQGGVGAGDSGDGVAEGGRARHVLQNRRQGGRQHGLQAAVHWVFLDDLLQRGCACTKYRSEPPTCAQGCAG